MSPHEILGVRADASEAEVRAAWLEKVKEFPPERDAAEFERIRDAYDALRDPRRIAKAAIFSIAFSKPTVSLLDGKSERRNFAGPDLWRNVLKTK